MKKIILLLFIIGLILGLIASNIDNPKELELTYQTNGGVPFKWEYEIEDETIVKFVKSYEIENKNVNGMVGAPISKNYVFKGLKKGTTTVTFKYINITDGTISKEEKHTLKVDKNKKISLIAIPN